MQVIEAKEMLYNNKMTLIEERDEKHINVINKMVDEIIEDNENKVNCFINIQGKLLHNAEEIFDLTSKLESIDIIVSEYMDSENFSNMDEEDKSAYLKDVSLAAEREIKEINEIPLITDEFSSKVEKLKRKNIKLIKENKLEDFITAILINAINKNHGHIELGETLVTLLYILKNTYNDSFGDDCVSLMSKEDLLKITNVGSVNRSLLFRLCDQLCKNFSITKIRSSIINANMIPEYLYILSNNKRNGIKKANTIMDMIFELSRNGNLNNYHEINFVKRSINSNFYNSTSSEIKLFGGKYPSYPFNKFYDIPINKDFYLSLNDFINGKIESLYIATNIFSSRGNKAYTTLLDKSLNKLAILLTRPSFKFQIEFLNKCIDKELDIHTTLDSFNKSFYKNLSDPSWESIYTKFFNRVFVKSKNSLTNFFPYINYKGVYMAKNLLTMESVITKIEEARRGFSTGKIVKSEMLFGENMPIKEEAFFTKEDGEIITIGARTGCCFKTDGAAKSLIPVAKQSPLAGIIEGKFKATWFSFVWEIIEFDEITNSIRTSLILDNIESLVILSPSDWDVFMKWLNKSKYSKVYLGNMRNKIDKFIINNKFKSSNTKLRPYPLICYEKNFNSYFYDDSKYVYTVKDTPRKSENLELHQINTEGELHRLLYAEKIVWGENSDSDVLRKLKYRNSPSFILRDKHGTIFSYLVTKLYSTKDEGETVIYDDSFNYRHLKEDEEIVLYLDDVFATNNRASKRSLLIMQNQILEFIKENNIKYVSASLNEYSRPFINRILDSGLKFISDTRFSEETRLIPSLEPKVSKLVSDRAKISKIGFTIKKLFPETEVDENQLVDGNQDLSTENE